MIPRLIWAFYCVCHVLSWLASSIEHSLWHLLKQKTEKKSFAFVLLKGTLVLHHTSASGTAQTFFSKIFAALFCMHLLLIHVLIYFDCDSDTDILLKSQMLTGSIELARYCSCSLLSAPAHQPISQATLNDKLALITAAWCNLWVPHQLMMGNCFHPGS